MGRRSYIKTSTSHDAKTMFEAIHKVRAQGMPLRVVAKEYGINYRTLMYHSRKFSDEDIMKKSLSPSLSKNSYKVSRQLITPDKEIAFAHYIAQLNQVYIGMTHKDIRKLGYEWSIANNVNIPQAWSSSKRAGSEWCAYFLKRHPELSTESRGLPTVASSFKENSEAFFCKLHILLNKYNIQPENLWNMDQIGLNTSEEKTICRRLLYKHTDQIVDTLSAVVTVSAAGKSIPPMFIFKQSSEDRLLLSSVPKHSIASINSTIRMDTKSFSQYLQHFVTNAKCNKKDYTLLLVDNSSSSLSMEALQFAKEYKLIILAIPARCSLKLQPLDRTIFEPFKLMFKDACEKWQESNPKDRLSLYHLPQIMSAIYSSTFTIKNIKDGFSITGIHPFDNEAYDTSLQYKDNEPSNEPKTSTNEETAPENPPENAVDTNKLLEYMHLLDNFGVHFIVGSMDGISC